jgi:hypothetical protein
MPLNRKRPEAKLKIQGETHPDRNVTYFGELYPGSKFVDGVWYFRNEEGLYAAFAYQEEVQPSTDAV